MKATDFQTYRQVFDVYDRCRSPKQTSDETGVPISTVIRLLAHGTKTLPAIVPVIRDREAAILREDERKRKMKNAEAREKAVEIISTSALTNIAKQMANAVLVPKGNQLANGRIEIDELTQRTMVGTAKAAKDLVEPIPQPNGQQQQNVNVSVGVGVGVDNRASIDRVSDKLDAFDKKHGAVANKMSKEDLAKMLGNELAKRKRARGEN